MERQRSSDSGTNSRSRSQDENGFSGKSIISGVEGGPWVGLVLAGVFLVSFLLDGGLSSSAATDGGTVPADSVAQLRGRSLASKQTVLPATNAAGISNTNRVESANMYVATNISTGMISVREGAASDPLYHNFALFEQDYGQMEKNFKIFVYPEAFEATGEHSRAFLPHTHPEVKTIGNYYSEHKFKITLLKSKFVTQDPGEAHLFYLPFSVNVLRNDFTVRTEPSIIHFVKEYIENVSREYEYWNRSLGADHFFACCHSVGRDVPQALPALRHNAIQLVCSSNYYYKNYFPHKDVALPQIWPRKPLEDLNPPEKRSRLAFYAGRIQNSNVRKSLIDIWGADPDFDFYGGGSNGSYEKHFQISKFCVHVRGYEVNTARVTDAIHFGCVPIIISDYYDLPLGDILDWSQFSVIISYSRIPDLKKILAGVTKEQYAVLYDNVLKVRKHFQWNNTPEKYDAFSLSLYQLWLKRFVVRESVS